MSPLSHEEILSAARDGDLQTLRYAVEYLGIGMLEVVDEEGVNCLHMASIGGQLAAVQLLLWSFPPDNVSGTDNTTTSCQPDNKCLPIHINPSNLNHVSSTSENPNDEQQQEEEASLNSEGRSEESLQDVNYAPPLELSMIGTCTQSSSGSMLPSDSARRGVSSRVSTRSSDTCPYEGGVNLKECLCPSCLVKQQLDTVYGSRNCLKCGDELVLDSSSDTQHPSQFGNRPLAMRSTRHNKPSPWANLTSHRGHTALHWATLKGYPAIVKELLLHGFEVDATSRQNATPLQLATVSNNLECAKVLLSYRADATIKTWRGSSASFAAKALGYLDIVEAIEKARAAAARSSDAPPVKATEKPMKLPDYPFPVVEQQH